MGRDYMTSPHKMKVHADRFFVAGITQLHYHAMYHQSAEAAYPGFNAWSTPHMPVSFAASIHRGNPIFEFFPDLNAYIARNQVIAQAGRNMANIGVFHGIWRYPGRAVRQEETVGGYLGPGDVPPTTGFPPPFEALTPEEQHIHRRMETADALSAAGYDHVLVNADSLLRGELRDGILHAGDIRMEALVLSHEAHLPASLARRLMELSAGGFPVFFVGATPGRHSGFHDRRTNDAAVRQMTSALATEGRHAAAHAALPGLLRAAGIAPGLGFDGEEADIHYIRREIGSDRYYFVRSAAPVPRRITVRLPCDAACGPWQVDLWTGVQTQAPAYERSAGTVTLPLDLDSFGSAMIRLGPGADGRHVERGDLPVRRIGRSLIVEATRAGTYRFAFGDGGSAEIEVDALPPVIALNDWTIRTLSRSPDGATTPLELNLDGLADWRDLDALRHEAGRALYNSTFVVTEAHLQEPLRLMLDLGRVHEVAEVTINGRAVDTLLMPPHRTDITDFVEPGPNVAEIAITPVLHNRLVGYGESGDPRWRHFQGRTGLAPTGLIGPVRLRPAWRERL
jgi:hypothetical protein